jgi:hypothetical protein
MTSGRDSLPDPYDGDYFMGFVAFVMEQIQELRKDLKLSPKEWKLVYKGKGPKPKPFPLGMFVAKNTEDGKKSKPSPKGKRKTKT